MSKKYEEEILKGLNTIIKLLVSPVKDKTDKKKISFLSNCQFSPKEIANILDTTPNTVSVALHNLKKKKGEKNDKPADNPKMDENKKDHEGKAVSDNQEQEKGI